MTIAYPPDTMKHLKRTYMLAPDGDEGYLCNADQAAISRACRDERRDYLIIDGHMYYPVTDGPGDIWEGRDVYAGRSIA